MKPHLHPSTAVDDAAETSADAAGETISLHPREFYNVL